MRYVILPFLALALNTLAAEKEAAAPTAKDALAEVNAAREARGLRPFKLDKDLARGAAACATYRARNRMAGHTSNDFEFLPPGGDATAAGCAAWPVELGWGACCTYDNYEYAGAAFCLGADGRRYMQLFVR
jgi:hypothetical protein